MLDWEVLLAREAILINVAKRQALRKRPNSPMCVTTKSAHFARKVARRATSHDRAESASLASPPHSGAQRTLS